MPIIAHKKDSHESLIEFYEDLASENVALAQISESMISLIDVINEMFPKTNIWGMTSHATLVLMPENDYKSRYIEIEYFMEYRYFFEYLIPEGKGPWPNATLKGLASSLDEAKKYLVISMAKSEGWKNSEELNDWLQKFNIKS